MRIHHLNCVSACPVGGLLMDGLSTTSLRGRLTSHCLLVETEGALVLVDTGYGLRDVAAPRARLSQAFLAVLRPDLREEMTAVRQIERLGFDPRDVRHVVLSHLDFDHAGGLDDFPQATVHLLADEVRAATAQRTVLDRMRYRPAQWGTRAAWRTYGVEQGETWMGFERVRPLAGVSPDVVMVPLIGHTLGHAGVAIRRDPGDWLFYAGDAYFYREEMDVARPRCTPGLRAYQTLMEKDRGQRLGNQTRLRGLIRSHAERGREAITVFCAHDVVEFEHLARRSARDPARPARPEAVAPTPAAPPPP